MNGPENDLYWGRLTFIANQESYCLVYEVEQDTVWVLVLVHTARQWPPVVE